MRTLNELVKLEELAYETGLRNEALQAEFERRANRARDPAKEKQRFAQGVVSYIAWLHKELLECYTDPNRSRPAPDLLPFPQFAERILGMSVQEYTQ